MDMKQIYARLDDLYQAGEKEYIEVFLIEMLKEAQLKQDYNSIVMLLNEMIEICKKTGQKEKALGYSDQVLQLMNRLGLNDGIAYATTLQNVAGACTVAGKLDEAYQFYMEVLPIYDRILEPDDTCYVTLYNQLSLLFQQRKEYERSVECLEKVLRILKQIENSQVKQAVTYTNIATSLTKLSLQTSETERDMKFRKAELGYDKALQIAKDAQTQAQKAIEIFRELEVMDEHMAAACCVYADALVLKREYEQAREYYVLALSMVENSVGITEVYQHMEEKLAFANAVLEGKIKLDEYGLLPKSGGIEAEANQVKIDQGKADEAKYEDVLLDEYGLQMKWLVGRIVEQLRKDGMITKAVPDDYLTQLALLFVNER